MNKLRLSIVWIFLCMLVLCSGCRLLVVTHDCDKEIESLDLRRTGGRYRVTHIGGGASMTVQDLMNDPSTAALFETNVDVDQDTMPIEVSLLCRDEEESWDLYNVFASLSCTVFPHMGVTHRFYVVEIYLPYGVVEHRCFTLTARASWSLFPLGSLLAAIPFDSYEFDDWDGISTPRLFFPGLRTFPIVKQLTAKAVASVLTQERYAEWLRQKSKRDAEERKRSRLETKERESAERQRCEEEVLKSAEQGWKNEGLLREFALKEAPSLWKNVQELRGELGERKALLKALREDLVEFGKNPDQDSDYRELVQRREELRKLLVRIFVTLEDAYIVAKKFEAEPSHKETERLMRQVLEEGMRDAEMVSKRYLDMRREMQK